MSLREDIKKIIAQKGTQPIFHAINMTIRNMRTLQYTTSEIKETLRDVYQDIDPQIDAHLTAIGY